MGNIASKADEAENRYSYNYNKLNQLVSITDPAGFVTSLEYDALSRKQSESNALNDATSYTYGAIGELLS